MSSSAQAAAPEAVLVYDGECAFCRRCIAAMHRFVPRAPRSVPCQDAPLDALGLTRRECDEAVQWVRGSERRSGARSVAAVREAMSVTFFHWGIHAWAIYAVVGLSLAYFGYRYNLPLTIRSGLYPLLKERIDGPIGHAVDIFAVVGTIFGLATSMGAGPPSGVTMSTV